MKTIFSLLLLVMLQSCYSYKTLALDNSKLVVGQRYKVNANDKTIKGKLEKINDSVLVFTRANREKTIQLSEIKTIKRRKFSAVKTLALLPITAATITLLYVLSDPDIQIGTINSPN